MLSLDNKTSILRMCFFSGTCCHLESFAAEYALTGGLAG